MTGLEIVGAILIAHKPLLELVDVESIKAGIRRPAAARSSRPASMTGEPART